LKIPDQLVHNPPANNRATVLKCKRKKYYYCMKQGYTRETHLTSQEDECLVLGEGGLRFKDSLPY
jgi:putative hemolysin